jgi:hypothetical protein
VEVTTRRSRSPGEREAALADALAYARRHLGAEADAGGLPAATVTG